MKEVYDVLIAEDHDEAREILREFVDLHSGFRVIGEVKSGDELLPVVMELEPDLLMVDINMPGKSGVEAVKECLEVYSKLFFIFVTAYDEYAIEAFDMEAVDYLVKPIQKKRVFTALEKSKRILKFYTGEEQLNHKVEVKFGREIYFIRLKDILFVEKIGRKLYIHTLHQVYETVDTLEHFSKQLNDYFFQSHRSCLLNVHHLTSIKISGKSYLGYFSGYDKTAPISKQRIEALKQKIKRTI
ncbi:LytTR family DNA-binding domain-containing protein [Halobacillus litoralis]|uniref:LytR/AlgR family response regulator transcription factor n=1 Tax=Halobacillus litoralis TaxID=45668 RepID=UPI001CD5BF7C|nr:LytTR family DNA-binding domain-containing protein [Halobacillus litoralis]MCA0970961.1 LytTR family DNA-binding domain-containing protein [Halobacillus litoralis]